MALPRTLSLALAALAAAGQEPLRAPAVGAPLGLPARAEPVESDELAALGARLFADPILSRDGSVACASCHRPDNGFADSLVLSLGVGGSLTARNTPTLLNRVHGESFSWDGRAATLEEQVLLPIEDPLEMDLALDDALARLSADEEYRAGFAALFGTEPTRAALASALAGFVRRLVSADSPVDRFRAGDFAALSDAERAGLWFYESRGGCWRCHGGANFSDEAFHNTGVGVVAGEPAPGRAAVTGRSEDRGRFKTPTLRGVGATAPYMHDGSLATLADVIEFYRQGGRANANLDPALGPIEMSAEDARNLEAFLRALSPR
jgi:cytochrome c peroxidase